jgi:hypothetical protein
MSKKLSRPWTKDDASGAGQVKDSVHEATDPQSRANRAAADDATRKPSRKKKGKR